MYDYSTGKEILHLAKFIIINLFIALEHTSLIYLYIYFINVIFFYTTIFYCNMLENTCKASKT